MSEEKTWTSEEIRFLAGSQQSEDQDLLRPLWEKRTAVAIWRPSASLVLKDCTIVDVTELRKPETEWTAKTGDDFAVLDVEYVQVTNWILSAFSHRPVIVFSRDQVRVHLVYRGEHECRCRVKVTYEERTIAIAKEL